MHVVLFYSNSPCALCDDLCEVLRLWHKYAHFSSRHTKCDAKIYDENQIFAKKKQITTQKFRLHSQSYVALWGSNLNSVLCEICM